ncbi:hypothetical protein ATP06_0216265 [Amycolatopsis regifaucium]|uniref:Uncharacterized protein n=1 Tax=Amycolatopsis regifaucium TaxID=546365 RepID=A0ABX3DSJ3_9PSEU|nr:hypothetical protein ATP06_0216265 [Amycolatopsis regifaucium]
MPRSRFRHEGRGERSTEDPDRGGGDQDPVQPVDRRGAVVLEQHSEDGAAMPPRSGGRAAKTAAPIVGPISPLPWRATP